MHLGLLGVSIDTEELSESLPFIIFFIFLRSRSAVSDECSGHDCIVPTFRFGCLFAAYYKLFKSLPSFFGVTNLASASGFQRHQRSL